ncbi:MAG TPA: UDP-N-acetylglucosamine 2-epimerase (hydrolyzing) [Lachnoclostridium sp.]|uniref:UDP-N-acetylglucosamine 2-epimerase n=1 Tax=Lacrimispora sp. TaxID=2719234 RepID=UPI000EBC11A9|nr:UDP-N-acetylglucosamine 2-epimerase [Lacrimispora sp.]HCD42799.1 UDP-N-acetylglucosamine 2-epimerase (hydrolyzing) [Lachnoclostridium sp.]
MIKLCVVTGNRAEYGLLKPVMDCVGQDPDFKLQVIATGSHLDTRYEQGEDIEKSGINIDEKIEMNLASDTSLGICKSMGLEMISLSEAYQRLKPDMVLLLGDRYEIFTAASAALICNIPIAHIHGGEITRGSYDDSMRHAISKMSYLHFTSTKEYRNRVIQLGEAPDRVHWVGALGIENMKTIKRLTRQELEEKLKISLVPPIALVTFHPATLDHDSAPAQFQPLEEALLHFPDLFVVFTKSNTDTGGNQINGRIGAYVSRNPEKSAVFPSLGVQNYLSLMNCCQAVIGNSSSGIIEAPFLKVPSVNIGSRQAGRITPSSVISCGSSVSDIVAAVQKALTFDRHKEEAPNPYEGQETSKQIVSIIKESFEKGIHLEKNFYDVEWRL